jgi:hypothetical protein
VRGILETVAYPLLAPIAFPARFVSGEELCRPMLSFATMAGILAAALLPLPVALRRRRPAPRAQALLVFTLLYATAHTILFGFVGRSYANWYALPCLAFLAIWLGYSWPAFLEAQAMHPGRRALLVSLLVGFGLAAHAVFLARLPHQPDRARREWDVALRALTKGHSDPVVVGAFNAGALAWAAHGYPNVKVTNLDCLVNNAAFEAVQQGTYGEYVVRTVDAFFEDPKGTSIYLGAAQVDSLCASYVRWKDARIWVRRRTLATACTGRRSEPPRLTSLSLPRTDPSSGSSSRCPS